LLFSPKRPAEFDTHWLQEKPIGWYLFGPLLFKQILTDFKQLAQGSSKAYGDLFCPPCHNIECTHPFTWMRFTIAELIIGFRVTRLKPQAKDIEGKVQEAFGKLLIVSKTS